MNVAADCIQVVVADFRNGRNIPIADEFPVFIIMSGREWKDLVYQAFQVLGFAGKEDIAVPVAAVEERADADGIPCGDPGSRFGVIEDQGEFRIQPGKHICTHLFVERQQDLAVTVAGKCIPLPDQLVFYRAEAVDLAVADKEVPVQGKGLHAFFCKAHDGQTLEAHQPGAGVKDPGCVGSAGNGS